jgi:hypothetical protein
MLFVKRIDMIKNLAAAASHPALGDTILPGRLNARSLRRQPVDFKNLMTSESNFELRSRMMY